ncbi:fimbria/pilus outer membrane usher protein [Pseudomonas hygromyciniae]|uniref:Fimbria/pilus outer membrane usher protein n=1 Tax=Pseudomonas hygromyciniae TaxID=2812000 RepID=A0ABX7K417_9PSED|nr:fimbria/pilus outer membrane usher protein [Pseudomonas hygromyciniae]
MQGRTERSTGQATQRAFTWNRYYAYRAIAPLRSRPTVGEDYLSSSLFDSFSYAGVNRLRRQYAAAQPAWLCPGSHRGREQQRTGHRQPARPSAL